MAVSQPLYATSNGSQAAQRPCRSLHANNPCSSARDDVPQWSQHQGINSLPSAVALSPNDQTHIVPSTHPHVPAVVSNFEDGEVYANPPIVAVRDSPLSTKGGTGRGELPARAKLVSSQNPSRQISSAESGMAQALLGCSDKDYTPTQHAPTTAAVFHQLSNPNSSTVNMSSKDELPTRATLFNISRKAFFLALLTRLPKHGLVSPALFTHLPSSSLVSFALLTRLPSHGLVSLALLTRLLSHGLVSLID
ncbi:hypothetical protein F0562_032177 [Nyssa sinensis]|uniref:Uncharacterized protein n=1 Tax=Nyssa sinensis TaxID=561372 RepID=A0A5J5AWL4_9ASTE|nr:hypothetical protein F0562_032177 [Nyssa sinensis]